MEIGEELDQFLVARVAVNFASGVELDAVAGGEENQFAVVESLPKPGDGIRLLARVERQPLPHLQRCGGVVQAK